MKNWSKCRNNCYEFNSVEDAKLFAINLGVEKDFLYTKLYPEIESPVIIYLFEISNTISAIVIIYIHTNELGLWVHPNLRGQGIGKTVFHEVLLNLENVKGRLFAFTNPLNLHKSEAMIKILLYNEFHPIISGNSLQPTLWVRSSMN
jgi:GNAT superfamily N-acetyltransferase